ncbi:hypothetical protein ACWDR1_33925 [Streptosporangium sandarakinum]
MTMALSGSHGPLPFTKPEVVRTAAVRSAAADTCNVALADAAERYRTILDAHAEERAGRYWRAGVRYTAAATAVMAATCGRCGPGFQKVVDFPETMMRSGYGRPVPDDTLPSAAPEPLRADMVAALKERGFIRSPEVEAAFTSLPVPEELPDLIAAAARYAAVLSR